MPYLATLFFPGGTEEQYRAMQAAVASNGPPEGETYHVAGPTENGFLVSSVWDSRESYERFHDTVRSVSPVEGGLQGRPEERVAEVVNLVRSD